MEDILFYTMIELDINEVVSLCSTNKDLKKDNPGLFMKNLMKYINNF